MAAVKKRRSVPEVKRKKTAEVELIKTSVSWTSELLAFLFVCLSAFVFLSLITHSIKNDPTGLTSSYNIMGPAGHFAATMLKGIFGWSSISISFITSALAVYFWISASSDSKKFLGSWYLFSLGSLLLLISLSIFLAIIANVKGGGSFGLYFSSAILNTFGYYGALLCASIACLFSFAIALQTSTIYVINSIFKFIWHSIFLISASCKKIFSNLWGYAIEQSGYGIESKTYAKELGSDFPKPKLRKNKVIIEDTLEDLESDPELEMTHIVVERRTKKDKIKALPNKKFENYQLPDLDLLKAGEAIANHEDDEALRKKSKLIEDKLKDFGVMGRITHVHPGPVITLFEFEPAAGVKVGKVAALQDDLSMSLKASSIRIIAPIPKRGTVGIEVPNANREIVRLRDVIESSDFVNQDSVLSVAMGKDVYGVPVVIDIAQMPHFLMAGSTGTGKSVSINTILLSLLFRATPEELGLILIDPKILELSIYEGIPHLKVPVVTVPKQAKAVLFWAVQEMERRYRLMQTFGVRNIDGFNKIAKGEVAEQEDLELEEETEINTLPKEELKPLPKIVIIVDELADLMLSVGREIEDLIARLAQKARAAGIHLILATQRPSVDVITGLIKANFPARVSFRVSSRIDSRTILDSMGAEKLLGRGDMLLMLPADQHLRRVHGAFVSDQEVTDVVAAIKAQSTPNYDNEIVSACEKALQEDDKDPDSQAEVEYDELYDQSVQLVVDKGYASTSMLQRAFRIGYNRAARIVDTMEKEGIIGPMDGARPREVLISNNSEL